MSFTNVVASSASLVPNQARGLGFTGGSYDSSTGVVSFTSDDGLAFSTGDLRGNLAAPGAIGGTTPGSAAFTTLSASGTATFTGNIEHSGTAAKFATGPGDKVIIGGTGTPGNQLEVFANTDDSDFVIKAKSADANAYIALEDNATTGSTYVAVGAEGDDLVFRSGNTDHARMTNTGEFIVGANARVLAGYNTAPGIQSLDTSSKSGGLFGRFSNDTTPSRLVFTKGRGAVSATSTIVQNGDELGEIVFTGADGSDLNSRGALIRAVVDGTPGTGDMPTKLEFGTSANGTDTPTIRLIIREDGGIELPGLRTTAGAANELWNNSGVINIS